MSEYGEQRLQCLAQQLETRISAIISGALAPYDSSLQTWAAKELVDMPSTMDGQEQLLQASTDCLVGILSCDDAVWDTSLDAFEANLRQLRKAHLR